MLIEFSVENFRSFRKRATLSMIAARLRATDEQLDHDNTIGVSDKLILLRSAMIYGANASGKSNIIQAVTFMRQFVLNSARLQEENVIPVEPFLLDTTGRDSPSTFEIVFLMDGLQYRYGFSVTTTRVIEEWLYFIPTVKEVRLFTRDEEGVDVGQRFSEGNTLKKLNLDNKLFLSVVAQFKKGGVAQRVREWFRLTCHALTTVEDRGYLPYTIECIEQGRYSESLMQFIRRLDLDITGLSVEEKPLPANIASIHDFITTMAKDSSDSLQLDLPGLTTDRTFKELRTSHAIRNPQGHIVSHQEFPAETMESEGTRKLIALAGPLFDVLTNGLVLFLDEIDSRLHPLITAAILKLFNSPLTNPKNAQIVCTTHDTNLLDRQIFRRDQVFFVEKDTNSISHLYSLAEFKLENAHGTGRTIRNDASFGKNYIQGRYGAIPYLGSLTSLFSEELNPAEHSSDHTGLVKDAR